MGVRLLDGISLTIPEGRILLVAGESGSGKSSLGRVLTGLIPHQYPAEISGSIRLDGEDILGSTPEQLAGRVAHVSAEPWSRFFQITVREELAFGPWNLGWSRERTDSSVVETARLLEIADLLDRRIDTLSAGQLQRLSIGTALVMESRWLVLDEPSAYLDLPALQRFTSLILDIRRQRHPGIVLLEHRLGEFAPIADDVAILSEGGLVFHGSRERFEERADEPCASFGLRHPDIRDSSDWGGIIHPGALPPGAAPLLEIDRIPFSYGKRKVLDSLSMNACPGEILGMTGLNGSGRTTLARIAAGLLKPEGGEARLNGERIRSADSRIAGMLFQDPAGMLFFDSVRSEILSGPENYGTESGEEAFRKLVGDMSLDGLLSRHPLRLSRGQRLRVAIATVLILSPKLVILDEPIRGQDWRSLSRMMAYLQRYIKDSGSVCILVSHEFRLIRSFADRVAVLEDGTIKASGSLLYEHDKQGDTA
jgi:energy-coupling factor transport system ATP-binding protein